VTNRLASVLSDHIPDGFRLEIRRDDKLAVTTFRYTRLADETWCQQVVEDALVDHTHSVEAMAFDVLRDVERKFFASDKAHKAN
jgi:hypothetical protein